MAKQERYYNEIEIMYPILERIKILFGKRTYLILVGYEGFVNDNKIWLRKKINSQSDKVKTKNG
jgi:hypothetical protein